MYTEEKLRTGKNMSATIAYDDFAELDLRVAEVIVVEAVEGSEKLLRLEVDVGEEIGQRQILAGIAQHYDPEELVGRLIVIVANLAPRSLMGLESQGMLLAATGPDGPILLDPGEAEPGAQIL